MGDIGMDVATGRAQAYIGGAVRNLAYVGEAGGGGVTFCDIYGVAGAEAASGTGWTVVGSLYLDPALFPVSGRTTTFFVHLAATSGMTAEAKLFNVTDGVDVAGSTVTTTSGAPERKTVAVTLPALGKLYSVQIRLAGGTTNDRSMCTSGGVKVAWS